MNLYAYCLNNPLSFVDPTGQGIFLATLFVVGSALLSGGVQLASNVASGKKGKDVWDGVATSVASSLVGSLVFCLFPAAGPLAPSIATGITQTVGEIIEAEVKGEDLSVEDVIASAVVNITVAVVTDKVVNACIPKPPKTVPNGFIQPKASISLGRKSVEDLFSNVISGINSWARNEQIKAEERRQNWFPVRPVLRALN